MLDGNHNKTAVLLPIAQWEEILLALEELDDIRAYDEAKRIEDEVRHPTGNNLPTLLTYL